MPTRPASLQGPPVATADRRTAPRLKPHEVPWLTEVKPIGGDPARLVDISRNGLLLETAERLLPGSRSAIVLVGADGEKVRAEGLVVRSQMVGIGPTGTRIYRTALSFTKEIDLRVPEKGVAAADEPAVAHRHPQLEGPLNALWDSETATEAVGVLRLTEIGCFVETTRLAVERERVSLMIFFSPVRSLRLTGEVVAVEPDRGCVLRFSNLGPDVRRSLRVEIREGLRSAPRPLAAELSLTQRDGVLGSVRVAWQVQRSDLHANQW